MKQVKRARFADLTKPKVVKGADRPLTFEEKLIAIAIKRRREAAQVDASEKMNNRDSVWREIAAFFELNDEQRASMSLFAFEDKTDGWFDFYGEYEGVKVGIGRMGGVCLVSRCPHCHYFVAGNAAVSNFSGLGEELLAVREEKWEPNARHLAVCPDCPEEQRPKAPTEDAAPSPSERLVEALKEVLGGSSKR